MPTYPLPPAWVLQRLRAGLVIPAHPLALTSRRRLDERRQRALTRYYHAAGAGGIAVGVHTTQFEIRHPEHGLLAPVLELAAETIAQCDRAAGSRTVRIAGICGKTRQALDEAKLAQETGYHCGLLSLAAWPRASDQELLRHCCAVAREIPLIGFYLQPSVGGRVLGFDFWRRFVELPNVVAIKVAPFNRYQTFDVVRAVAESGRTKEIALYTGNDDSIVHDLLTTYSVGCGSLGTVRVRMVGGLLGHWACWTRAAVQLLADCHQAARQKVVRRSSLTLAAQVTDCNAAFFDAAHHFSGCIPGIHEVLRRQGLMGNNLCLDANLRLSLNQAREIERVWKSYPHLNDDAFVRKNLARWLAS
jgi:dihydrodipicolinate synthase/N-acetylneuraminate lyase